MPVDLPQWFIERYSKAPDSAPIEQPAQTTEKPKEPPYLRYLKDFSLNEPADTQQEREQLSPSAIQSTQKKIDPVILDKLTEKGTPPLTSPPKREFPSFQPGKQVFTDQKQLDQIIAEAPEEGRLISFGEAFKRARKAGLPDFEYKGDRFNTQQKGESTEQWLTTLKQNKVPQTFADYMELTGVITAKEKAVDVSAISKNLGPALNKIAPVFQKAGITPEITSGQRNWGEWSLHEIGEAIDMRLKTANPQSLRILEESLPGEPIPTSVEGEKGRMWTDGTFEYFVYGKGDRLHLHIERESDETKQRLINHMIKLGLKHKIPQKELEQYMSK